MISSVIAKAIEDARCEIRRPTARVVITTVHEPVSQLESIQIPRQWALRHVDNTYSLAGATQQVPKRLVL